MKQIRIPHDVEDDYDIYTMLDDQFGHFVGFAVGKRGEVRKKYKDQGYKLVGKSLMIKKRTAHGACRYAQLAIR